LKIIRGLPWKASCIFIRLVCQMVLVFLWAGFADCCLVSGLVQGGAAVGLVQVLGLSLVDYHPVVAAGCRAVPVWDFAGCPVLDLVAAGRHLEVGAAAFAGPGCFDRYFPGLL